MFPTVRSKRLTRFKLFGAFRTPILSLYKVKEVPKTDFKKGRKRTGWKPSFAHNKMLVNMKRFMNEFPSLVGFWG